MLHQSIITLVRKQLAASSDEKTKLGALRFFKEKENIRVYGCKTAVVTKIGKQAFTEIKDFSKAEIFALCEELWQNGMLEEAFIACNWSYYIHTQYDAEDFTLFERWITQYITNWATCDTLCNHSVGTLLGKMPRLVTKLLPWTQSANRWIRRAAAVSLIVPARKGMFQKEIIKIAEKLLHDEDDMVQKGYGWVLKSAADFDRETFFQFVMKHKATMPRTALRYAIEKMPPEMRKKAMEK